MDGWMDGQMDGRTDGMMERWVDDWNDCDGNNDEDDDDDDYINEGASTPVYPRGDCEILKIANESNPLLMNTFAKSFSLP